jgi:hypothetical protein
VRRERERRSGERERERMRGCEGMMMEKARVSLSLLTFPPCSARRRSMTAAASSATALQAAHRMNGTSDRTPCERENWREEIVGRREVDEMFEGGRERKKRARAEKH